MLAVYADSITNSTSEFDECGTLEVLKKGQFAGPNASERRMATAERFIRRELQPLFGSLQKANWHRTASLSAFVVAAAETGLF